MSSNQTINALRRYNARDDQTGDQMNDFLQRQANGEKPNPNEFMDMLQKRAAIHDAMQAQFKLYEKPIKTVLNDAK
jgi:hypothetical protein